MRLLSVIITSYEMTTSHNKSLVREGGYTKSNKSVPNPLLPSIVIDSKTNKEYHTGCLLGTGGFAKVFSVTEINSNLEFADKVISKNVFKKKNNAKEKVEKRSPSIESLIIITS